MINKLWFQLADLVDSHNGALDVRVMVRKNGDTLEVFAGRLGKDGVWVNKLDRQYPYTEEGLRAALSELSKHLENIYE